MKPDPTFPPTTPVIEVSSTATATVPPTTTVAPPIETTTVAPEPPATEPALVEMDPSPETEPEVIQEAAVELEAAEVIIEPEPVPEVAVADAGAVRTGETVQETPTLPPPPAGLNGMPFAPEGLSDCDEMAFYRIQAGLPERFQGIGWRESNCRNEDGVRTSCCHGYWQIHRMHLNGSGYVYGVWCDAYSYHEVNSDTPLDKQRQACAAKALLNEQGMGAWAATS